MTTQLTPYDTGDRLEPQPWPLESDDHYGLVDLDNDESATVFTISGKRLDDNTANRTADGSPGYLLSVSTYSDDTAVEIDGDRVLVLDEDTLAGLCTLIELARRGRDDFQHQAETTRDYSEEDIAAADDAWHLAQQTVKAIQGDIMTEPTTPTILHAKSSADFLAALPRLTGMRAPESLFIVLFEGPRTLGCARVDLPPAEQMADPGDEIAAWLHAVAEIALKGDTVAIVVNTDAVLSEQPVSSPHGALTGILADVLHAAGASVLDALAVGSDGWTSFVGTNFPELHSLDEITGSTLHDPDHEALSLDEWRAQHPGKTADDPEQIEAMAAQMRASGSKENPS